MRMRKLNLIAINLFFLTEMTTAHLIIPRQWEKSEVTERQENHVQEVAANELKEDEKTREQCLAHLREWIRQNRDIDGCILDDRFLLRFLRSKKFSLHMAQQMVLKYLNLRKCFSHIFYNLDWKDEKFVRLLIDGYVFPSPFRDKNGRRVVLTVLSKCVSCDRWQIINAHPFVEKFDASLFTSTDMARAHVITYETMIEDEETQIFGFNHVADIAGASPSIVTMWSVNEFATLVKWSEVSALDDSLSVLIESVLAIVSDEA